MFYETAGPAASPVMVYNTALIGQGGQVRTPQPQRRHHQKKACCASCAQHGLSGLSGCGCSPMEVIVIQEPTSETQSTTTATANGDFPGWLILVALGVGAVLILK